jgi:hypothetical protein
VPASRDESPRTGIPIAMETAQFIVVVRLFPPGGRCLPHPLARCGNRSSLLFTWLLRWSTGAEFGLHLFGGGGELSNLLIAQGQLACLRSL